MAKSNNKKIGRRNRKVSITNRINEIINTLKTNSSENSDALLRLLPLIRVGYLNESELTAIKNMLWPDRDFTILPEIGLLKFTLLELSYNEKESISKCLSEFLFEKLDDRIFNYEHLMELVNASLSEVKFMPSKTQALEIFEKLVLWERDTVSSPPLIFNSHDQNDLADMIGKTLSRCVIPALGEGNLTEDNFFKLLEFYHRENSHEIIYSFSFFIGNNEVANDVEKIIINGLQSVDSKKVSMSAFSILKISEIADKETIERLVTRLVYLVCSNRDHGMVNLLWTINELAKKGVIKEIDMISLIDILPVLFDNYGYGNKKLYNSDSNTASLVRAYCVKLARTLLPFLNDGNKGNIESILLEAKSDALPEVRFA